MLSTNTYANTARSWKSTWEMKKARGFLCETGVLTLRVASVQQMLVYSGYKQPGNSK